VDLGEIFLSYSRQDSGYVKELFAFLKAQLKSGELQTYPALVTDVRNMGFFVDVPGLAMSGLVPFSELKDDFYVFDPTRLQVVGRRTRRVIKLGDRLDVQVARVDRFKKQVDFRVAQGPPATSSKLARPAAPPRNRGDRFPRPFDPELAKAGQASRLPKAAGTSQDRDGSRHRPGPARAPATERTLRSAHSGRPMLPRRSQSDAPSGRGRPDQQSQRRDRNFARDGRPEAQQQSRDGQPSHPPKAGQPQRPKAQPPVRPGRSGSWRGQGSRSRRRRPSVGRQQGPG